MADAAPGPGKLAGRDRELAALRRWLAKARARHGRLAVLAGPPGTGKTRLTEELACDEDSCRILSQLSAQARTKTISEAPAVSVETISGWMPVWLASSPSRTCRLSRWVPGISLCANTV